MSDGPKRRDRLARVLDALQAAAGADKGVRSPLYNWLKKNHDDLSAAFAETPPSWSALAATFGKIGLTDRDGKVPTPKAAAVHVYDGRRACEVPIWLDPPKTFRTPPA